MNEHTQPDPVNGNANAPARRSWLSAPSVGSLIVMIALIGFSVISFVVSVFLPVPVAFKLLPLLCSSAAAAAFVINRIWVTSERLLGCQILVGSFIMGVTGTMLVMMACFYWFSQSSR